MNQMLLVLTRSSALVLALAMFGLAVAQTPPTAVEVQPPATNDPTESATDNQLQKIDEVVEQVNQSEQAQEIKTGILEPIYSLAESFSFSAFHWLAFAVMVTGVVSYALQLVLGKLVVLSRRSLSLTEVLSDALGLAVSLIGLVLTTQAATENSTFTSSAFAVLSATAVGAVLGILFYVWGQRQELQAVAGRQTAAATKRAATDQPVRK